MGTALVHPDGGCCPSTQNLWARGRLAGEGDLAVGCHHAPSEATSSCHGRGPALGRDLPNSCRESPLHQPLLRQRSERGFASEPRLLPPARGLSPLPSAAPPLSRPVTSVYPLDLVEEGGGKGSVPGDPPLHGPGFN